MEFFIAAPTSLDVERSIIRALEIMGFEKDIGEVEIDDKSNEVYFVKVVVRQVKW